MGRTTFEARAKNVVSLSNADKSEKNLLSVVFGNGSEDDDDDNDAEDPGIGELADG